MCLKIKYYYLKFLKNIYIIKKIYKYIKYYLKTKNYYLKISTKHPPFSYVKKTLDIIKNLFKYHLFTKTWKFITENNVIKL